MKRILVLLSVMMLALQGQAQVVDSAEWVVDRHVSLMNMAMLPKDSMLFVVTCQIDRDNPTDTIMTYRWEANRNRRRVEVWQGRRLDTGYILNGKDHSRYFDTIRNVWRTVQESMLWDNYVAYEFKGPLYYRKSNGAQLRYMGEKTFNGHPIYAVQIDMPQSFKREYYFEKESGVLFMFKEFDEVVTDSVRPEYKVDWYAYHEYEPLGMCLYPKTASYQNNGHVYIIINQAEIMPIDDRVFDQNQAPKEYTNR